MTVDAALQRLQTGDADGALALLDATCASDGSNPSIHVARGMALLATNRHPAALSALRTAVALGDSEPTTLLNLAIAEDRAGDPSRACALFATLEQRLPHWDEPSLRRAESLRAAGHLDAAEVAYHRVLEINPNRLEALIALAGLRITAGAGPEARDLLFRSCTIAPTRAEAWHALGLAMQLTGETSPAYTAFVEAQRLEATTPEYAVNAVDAALACGRADAELLRLDLAIVDDPANPVLLLARGVLLERLCRRSEAIDALEAAVALVPDSPLPAGMLAGVLARSNRLREADAALQRAGELDPHNPRFRNDRATVLMRMHRHAEARALLLELVEHHGEEAPVLCNLANATVCLGLQDQAVSVARRAIALDPDAVLPRRALCNALPYLDGVSGATLLDALRACAAKLPRVSLPSFANARDPERALTIGLLSGTLKTHPVGWLTIAGFETLEPSRFALVCLAQNATPSDPIARRFRAVAREWIDIDGLDDVALAMRAREAGIDVLIDLGGYGDAARMPACAYRLAPVQVKWVGMQNHSSGLPEMDWFITDRWETPPELENLYSERLLRLPDGYVSYSPPAYAPDVAPLPALTNGYVTFGCFNNLAKVTPRVIATWSRILQRLPTARLVFKTHQFADQTTSERLQGEFEAHGVARARIELRGSSPHRAFMAEYGDIDMVLDPFPYSGGLTTCEALWMGVPTVTVPGEIFASRHSMSHMCNAGLSDWVASDLESYIELAIAKAGDIRALAALRAELRSRVKASPLCDARRFGRNLGAALRFAWQDWCERNPEP